MVCRINEWRPVLRSSHLFTKGPSGGSRSGSSGVGCCFIPRTRFQIPCWVLTFHVRMILLIKPDKLSNETQESGVEVNVPSLCWGGAAPSVLGLVAQCCPTL